MSRPWMPLYWGDYLADTAHLTTLQHGAYLLMIAHCWQHDRLPSGDAARAAVAKLTVREWQKMKSVIEAFFQPDGSHKRVIKEAEKAERKIMQRALAGRSGGIMSGIARAMKSAKHYEANEANAKQNGSKRASKTEAKTKQPRTNHNSKNLTFSSSESRTSAREENLEPAGALATALPTGALARQPTAEQPEAKPPQQATRAELEAAFARKRTANGQQDQQQEASHT